VGIQWEKHPRRGPEGGRPRGDVFDVGPYARTWTGHADDPFFFDARVPGDARSGDLSIKNDRDFLAGLNVTAAAIEIDTDVIAPGPIQVWVTASRKM